MQKKIVGQRRSTSGRNLVTMRPEDLVSKGYVLDWHGTVRRTAAKVSNKSSKRLAKAACAC